MCGRKMGPDRGEVEVSSDPRKDGGFETDVRGEGLREREEEHQIGVEQVLSISRVSSGDWRRPLRGSEDSRKTDSWT